jgi:hypothetical protein
MIVGVEETDGI